MLIRTVRAAAGASRLTDLTTRSRFYSTNIIIQRKEDIKVSLDYQNSCKEKLNLSLTVRITTPATAG